MRYSAVVTTGIYCRPGCGARPHERNVRGYALAAEAEVSGFRACLRCRPYRTQPAMRWTDPEMVCRGVQLVLAGALDGGTEETLGTRLGISPRHLRRLFREHVGVTPDQLARSARTHFARRLLDDTDLTVVEIATAAGFGSVRQFNRACLDVFRAPPGDLRKRRRLGDRLVADGGLTLRLPYEGELCMEPALEHLACQAIAGVEVVATGSYRRCVVIDGDPGVIELMAGEPGCLRMRLHLPHWEGLIHHVQRARRIFELDRDYGEGASVLRDDPLIGALIEARPGLRMPGAWDPFAVGVRAIAGSAIAERIAVALGAVVPGLKQLGLLRCFPEAAAVAEADLGQLTSDPTTAVKLRRFSQMVADGRLRLDGAVGLDELIGTMTGGIGLESSTAHYIALRLGERDAFPVESSTLVSALSGVAGRPLSVEDVTRISEAWRPWRGVAAAHLLMG